MSVGVLRRWRWAFWLILIAFLARVLRVPAAILQLTTVLPARTPNWYVAFQGLIGLVQLAIGLAMLADYRTYGCWGNRRSRNGYAPRPCPLRAASGDNADAMTDRLDQDAVRARADSIIGEPYESDHNPV